MHELLQALNDKKSQLEITAERAFLRALDGNCRTPIAALANWDDETLSLRGEIIATDGSLRIAQSAQAVLETTAQAYDMGFELGTSVRDEVDGRITFDV